jgi:hypothetical protein
LANAESRVDAELIGVSVGVGVCVVMLGAGLVVVVAVLRSRGMRPADKNSRQCEDE